MRKRGIQYYYDKVPNTKRESNADTLGGMIQDFKDFKEAVRNYYLSDLEMKERLPITWGRLTKGITKLDIHNIKVAFRNKFRMRFIEELDTDDYELD
ncbi:hypothetical protein AGMMS50212_14350 [Spirochaetia bacterium]|nr:hypothetical protein AGMMS50212_14350 [Spirochaetia bacterium]